MSITVRGLISQGAKRISFLGAQEKPLAMIASGFPVNCSD